MILESISVRNFRSIKNATLYCDNLTTLVGANGSGKSNFLHAIELFQSKSPTIDEDDYYNRDTAEDIEISITFKNLSRSAKKLFAIYIQNDNLTVERILKWNYGNPTMTFHGSILRNPDFVSIFKKNATNAKKEYNKLKNENYKNLPRWSNHEDVKKFLKQWETKNPDKCKRLRDDGQFFGFNEVAQGFLGRFVRFLYISAARDATKDVSESRGSVMTELMDLVIRKSLAERMEIKKFQEDTRKRYVEVMDLSKLKELTELENNMTETLQNFVPNTKINLTWKPLQELMINLPEAEAHLIEDGYPSTVERAGHGLQRAFIMTMLQHLSVARANRSKETNQFSDESNTLVFMIDEPELYQHPNRQRHLAELFHSLTRGTIPGVSRKTQIIYSTHSPHFVGIDRINQIRLLRKKVVNNGKPKTTKIFSTNLQKIVNELSRVPRLLNFTVPVLQARLHRIMTPWMNEGFFSDVVVLVEGEDDRAAIIAVANSLGYKFDGKGISVIPCFGKTILDKPAVIFRNLGIPIYVIWDGDKGINGANPKENRNLLLLMKQSEEDWPSIVADTFACFETNMQSVLKKEIGKELFENCINEYTENFSIKENKIIKNPIFISEIIEKAKENGRQCKTLEAIVDKIVRLRTHS